MTSRFMHTVRDKLTMSYLIFCMTIIGFLVIYILSDITVKGIPQISFEFLFTAPKSGMAEGGIFPAIYGTVLLVLIMTLALLPVGVISAIFLRLYAGEKSVLTKWIRFAVDNLAGIPSIVYGLFGLGFFIQFIGLGMDKILFPPELYFSNIEDIRNLLVSAVSHTNQGVSETIYQHIASISLSPELIDILKDQSGLQDILNTFSRPEFMEHASKIVSLNPEAMKNFMDAVNTGNPSQAVQTSILNFENLKVLMSIISKPGEIHYGKPALIWAALTLALLNLPVVIVTTEEAIKTVPRAQMEAAYALGATKLQVIFSIILPQAIPGILTGAILSVSRGAGEVAPVLFTGAAYFLPHLPTKLTDQFMELGNHIFVMSTQSPDVEKTKPLLYGAVLVLLVITFVLNFSAILIRSRYRKKMAS